MSVASGSERSGAASLARVARGDLCAGCGGCVAIAPGKVAMETVAPGYLRPVMSAPLTLEEDAAIARVCPGLGQRVAAEGRTDHALWGPYVAIHTGWATDPDLRHAGASGGALSAVLTHLVESGEVDAVIQVGADPAMPIGNATVTSGDRDAIRAAAGSRYAPSAPLDGLPERLAEHRETGRRFAFVGKPCDVAALAALRSERPDVAAAIPVLLSFFCAGVPSHAGARAILEALGAAEEEVRAFRYRGEGWPGRATALLADGRTLSMSYQESWGGILSRHVQHRCKICADGTGAAADLVCADAWESDAAGYPLFDEAPGVSLIVARTPLGERLLTAATEAGRIETRPFDVADLAAIQPGQRERRRALGARLLALRVAGRPVPRYEGLRIAEAARQNPLARNARNFLGMLRRTLRPRRP